MTNANDETQGGLKEVVQDAIDKLVKVGGGVAAKTQAVDTILEAAVGLFILDVVPGTMKPMKAMMVMKAMKAMNTAKRTMKATKAMTAPQTTKKAKVMFASKPGKGVW